MGYFLIRVCYIMRGKLPWRCGFVAMGIGRKSGRDTNSLDLQTPKTVATAMSEEGYPASTWEHTDSETLASSIPNHSQHNHRAHPQSRDPYLSLESLEITAPLTPSKSLSPPRSSGDSPTRSTQSRWRENAAPAANSRDTPTSAAPGPNDDVIVEAGFDENVLRALCDLDVSTQAYKFPSVLNRIVWVVWDTLAP